MVGEAARLRRAAAALAAATLLVARGAAAPPPVWTVEGNCRDGRPQGPYELRGESGQLRVAGAFNEGRRTGSFIFWAANGARVAHVPYDDDVRNGTIAIWYPGSPGREPPRRLESVFHRGNRDGLTRTWYADGHRRSETEYAAGRIVASAGWSDSGASLGDEAAREIARRDAADADADYAELDALIREHSPRCE